jgi:hypothetical protein
MGGALFTLRLPAATETAKSAHFAQQIWTETTMRRIPDATDQPAFTFTASPRRRAQRSDDELGLDCLARTLDHAALNVSGIALDGARDAALRPDLRGAADAARGMADQITGQLKALELALSEVALPARR